MNLILETKGLNKSFGTVNAAKNVNTGIKPGEIVGIIGANGAGKTSYVNLVTGHLHPDSGTIAFRGKDITGMKPRRIARMGLSRSFQVSQVFHSETVMENILVATSIADSHGLGILSRLDQPGRRRKALEHLELYGIAEHQNTAVDALPQGTRKLLDIAMATISDPEVLLLDEPTSGVSMEEKFGLMDTIMGALAMRNVTVLFIEHDMEIVSRYVDRVLAFYQGQIICNKPTADALEDPDVRTYVTGTQLAEADHA